MKRLTNLALRAHNALPYTLQESPVDPVTIILVLPLLIGYTAVILLANLV